MKKNNSIKKLGRMLAYINRAKQYISTINTVMILILLFQSFNVELQWYIYPILILLAIFIFLIVGFVDTKLGIRKMESLDNELNRPVLMEMRESIRNIEKYMKLEKNE